jgi:hypothetical protein
MTTCIRIPDDDMGGRIHFSYIAEEYEYMITIECYNFFSLLSLPCEVTIDVPIFTRVFP